MPHPEPAMGQIPLALELDSMARFETFVPRRNRAVYAHVAAVAAGDAEQIWLAGPSGSGKSHLLQAACRAASAAGRRSMYLPLGGEGGFGPEALHGLEALDLVALDECERVAGRADWEAALFELLNGLRDGGSGLLMASRQTPKDVPFELPDLASRMRGAVLYRLRPIGETGRLEALRIHARQRGLAIDEPTARYLLSRVERDVGAVCAWLEKLDQASLSEQRRLSIPFVRQVLAGTLDD